MLHHKSPLIQVNDAHVAYGQRQALNGLSLDLHAGELLGLFGPNGAGKTTLIQCIAARQTLDRGYVRIAGAGQLADRLGIVPQEIALYPDLTVRQNLSTFGRLHGLTGRKLSTRMDQALQWARLEARAGALVQTLSGGMQRRLNIACSVMHQPQILLLDEPTVGIDPQSRERIYEMLESLRQQGTAILLTTHQLDEVQARCDRMAIIDAGRIIESGTFQDLLDRTIGSAQQLRVSFAQRQTQVPAPLKLTESGKEAYGLLHAGNGQIPKILSHFLTANVAIEHLVLREPTLEHLFLHLTGRELRE
jgi:ABC-2 type transport system ATP-binding protein